MFSRITFRIPLILVTLSIACCLEMSWLAGKKLAFAAEPGNRTAAEGGTTELRTAPAAAAGNAADHSAIAARRHLGLPSAGKNEEVTVTDPVAGLQKTALELVLVGVVNGGNQDSRAVILSRKDQNQRIYQVGDMVAGAQIKSILRGKVVLAVNGRHEILDMSGAASLRAKEAAIPVPAPAFASPREKGVASSESWQAGIDSRLIPEKVRLVLPEEPPTHARSGD